MNKKQIKRASEILDQIKTVNEMLKGCDNFVIKKFYKMFCAWKTEGGTTHCNMELSSTEMEPIFTAYIDKLKAELKELGYEDD